MAAKSSADNAQDPTDVYIIVNNLPKQRGTGVSAAATPLAVTASVGEFILKRGSCTDVVSPVTNDTPAPTSTIPLTPRKKGLTIALAA